MNDFQEKATDLDKADSLSKFREYFVNEPNTIYLDGNSLGKCPKKTYETIDNLVKNQWANGLIRSWNNHWIDLPDKLAAKIAKIIGAEPDEVFVGDSTSINFFKLAFAALKFQEGRKKIITDSLNFPTDLYVLYGLIAQQFNNHKVEVIGNEQNIEIKCEEYEKSIDENTALITLSLVTYKSAFLYDMGKINELANVKGALTIWDLSHASGAIPIHLNETKADMAVGCTYKYLNGGPGAPAYLYVRKDLQEKLLNPIWAWFSHQNPFDFDQKYTPKNGIHRFATGTPSVLSLAAIEPGLDIILEAGIENIRNKSIAQSQFLVKLIKDFLLPLGFSIASPLNVDERGSHISIQHAEGYRINKALIEPKLNTKKIIPDFRPPNNIRLGIAPLYNSFTELYETVIRIKLIVETEEYLNFGVEKVGVV